jgi:oxygen-independent coproporphyrinogen III oxidase
MDTIDKKPKDLGLYIHIPFCVRKCDYCDFLSAPASEDSKKDYINGLITEIESYSGLTQDYIVPTIFIGGGTPSSIDASYIKEIMETIHKVFQVDRHRLEATIEVNPGTVTRDKLMAYRESGINRLSFGLQSVDNKELKLLGRIHTYEQFEENYYLARETGFSNINIDLMSALPGQSLATWEKTLNTVIDLKPEHISAYSLIIEEGTKFYDRYHDDTKAADQLPDEETDRQMYYRTKELLALHGYHRYEISNYAKEAYECRHNTSYWIGTDYLGLGLGASSLLDGARFSNMHDMKQYILQCNEYKNVTKLGNKIERNTNEKYVMKHDRIGIRHDYEELTPRQRMEEFMFLGLRLCNGISKKAFFHRFHVDMDHIYSDVLSKLSKRGVLEITGDTVRLTEYGIDVSNTVLSEFLFD